MPPEAVLSPHDLLRRPLVDQRAALRLLETHLSAGKVAVTAPDPAIVRVTHRRTGKVVEVTWAGRTSEELLRQIALWRDFLETRKA